MFYRITFYILPAILVLFGIRKYQASKWGKCKNKVKLDKKTVIITGANSGIGYEVAKELASRNAIVILACRSLDKATSTVTRLKQCLGNDPILIPMVLDLASLKSVKSFASLIKQNHSSIDILINNAGVAYKKGQKLRTEDGFEVHFGVNHLGHFYLTKLLEDTVAAAKGRIIVVTSSLLEKGKLDFKAIKNLDFNKDEHCYANSKLANIYFAQELAKRTKEKGINVYAVTPGWVYTGLFRYTIKWYHYAFAPLALLFLRSAKQGSQTVTYCATEPSLSGESGLLYRDCKIHHPKMVFFDKVGKDLWEVSEQMVSSVIQDTY